MDEKEWLYAADPMGMLDYLRRTDWGSDRKLRLFSCACVRRIWALLTDERSRKAVEVAEIYADGLADRAQLLHARDEAREAKRLFKFSAKEHHCRRAANAAQEVTRDAAASAAFNASVESSRALSIQDHNCCSGTELQQQTIMLRDIVANPFAPSRPIDPALLRWNDGTVLRIATGIYEERAFERLPVLADALLDSGCDDETMLEHCRQQEGVHSKGCWVIDLILGKK